MTIGSLHDTRQKLIAKPHVPHSPGSATGRWQLTTAVLIHNRDRKMMQVLVRIHNGADIAGRKKAHEHNNRDDRHHPESRALQLLVDCCNALLII